MPLIWRRAWSRQRKFHLSNYEEVEAEGKQRGEQGLVLGSLVARGTVYGLLTPFNDSDRNLNYSEQALDLAIGINDREAEARALWNLMLLYRFGLNDPHRAIQCGKESLAIARDLDLLEQQAFVLHDLQYTCIMIADCRRAREFSEDAILKWRKLGNLSMLADALNGSALISTITGNLEQAVSAAEEGYHVAKSIGVFYNQAVHKGNLSIAYRELGQ
jgi:tetratricopeptide (TPR) repeat protein